jgi:hypothetical protein
MANSYDQDFSCPRCGSYYNSHRSVLMIAGLSSLSAMAASGSRTRTELR